MKKSPFGCRAVAWLISVLVAVTVAACGGGGSGGDDPPPATRPSLTAQPANLTVTAGAVATFSVTAGGTPPLTYQWLRDDVALAGATASSYTTPPTADADTGSRYKVTVSNAAGSVTSDTATLTVTPAPLPPAISSQPAGVTVNEGQSATFAVVASSNNSAPTFLWRRDGVDIAAATGSDYTTPAAVAADDGAQFTVAVTNAAGTTVSTVGVLTVIRAPRIGTQPEAVAAFTGQTATFSVAATGTAPLLYQWQRNGVAIAGAQAASYTTPTLTPGDNGASFVVVLSNSAGSATSVAAGLTVTDPPAAPAITSQPQPVTVLAGRSAAFTVSASGTGTLAYQWHRNAQPIAGAEQSSYATGPLAWTDDGALYSVVVTNAEGQAVSQTARLSVTPRVVQISAGGYLASARKEDGTAWGWGEASLLGNGNNGLPYGSMVRAMNTDGSRFDGVTSLVNGYVHTLALKTDGSLWAWGGNTEGEIGQGYAPSTSVALPYPLQVKDSAGNAFTGVVAIAGGWRHSLALKADGTVWGWGYALSGRLGNSNQGGVRNFPSPVAVLATGGAPLTNIIQIAASDDHAMALRNDGSAWIWGNGQAGRLGDGQRNSVAVVAQRLNDALGQGITNVTQVSVGYDHSLALKNDGTALAWGVNAYGQLGDGTYIERTTPVIVKDEFGNPFGGIASIAAGERCTFFLRTDGTVWVVGRNNFGQLARGTALTWTHTVQQVLFADGRPLDGVTQIALFDRTLFVLRSDHSVWGWGDNALGELGYAPTNALQFSTVPVRIPVSGD